MADKISLDEAIKHLNKQFGETYVGEFSQKFIRTSTGVFSLDLASGGGLPQGKVMTIAGCESSGKTTVALNIIAQFQKAYPDKKVAYLDTDNGLDLDWAAKFGVDTKSLLVIQPDYLEMLGDTIETLLCTDAFSLIVWDSVPATLPKVQLEESCDKQFMGGNAKGITQVCNKISVRLRHVNTSIVIINQIRDKIGAYGNAEMMPGGHSLKHLTDILVWLKKGNWIPETGEPRIGIGSKFRITKNRTAPPLKVGEFDIYFEGLIDNNTSIVLEAMARGAIVRKGAWFHFGEHKCQGKDELIKLLVEKKMLPKLEEKLRGSSSNATKKKTE